MCSSPQRTLQTELLPVPVFPMSKIFLRPLPVMSSFRKSDGTPSEATGDVLTLGDRDPSLDPSTGPDAITILKHLVLEVLVVIETYLLSEGMLPTEQL